MSEPTTRADEELLVEQRAGAAGPAFAAFFERHEHAILGYFVRRTADPETAADLAAETFAEALAHRYRFRRRPDGSAVGWLFGIARHVLGRSLRRGRVEDRARRRIGLTPLALEDAALVEIERLGTESAVLEALERLPESQRVAVRSYVLEDHGYADIAAHLECSEAVVRKRVSRGLATLRREIEESA